MVPETNDEIPKDYAHARRMMMNEPFIHTPRYWEQQQRANRHMAHPEILRFSDALVEKLRTMYIPFFAHTVVRSRDEQKALFLEGRSKNDGSGPYPHQAFAVDLVHGVHGWNLGGPCWDLVGHIGRELAKSLGIPITWGGDWDWNPDTPHKLYDPAHWELSYWRSLDPKPPFMHLKYGAKKTE